MAVVLGTNAGFVTTAPTADPGGSNLGVDASSRCTKDTCPADVSIITEVGWYQGSFDNTGSYAVGLYSHNSGSNTANALLESSTGHTMTGMGWQVVSGLNWSVTPGTVYWLATAIPNTTPNVTMDYVNTGGRTGINVAGAGVSLPDPFASASDTDYILALYAKVESGSQEYAEGTKTVTAAGIVSLATDTVAVTEGTKIVTAAGSVSLDTESYKSNSTFPSARPSDFDGDLYWHEDTGTWTSTRTQIAGAWAQHVVVVSEEGEVYFRSI